MKISTKEEVILEYLRDVHGLVVAITCKDIEPSAEVRQAIIDLGDPWVAYIWAYYIDETAGWNYKK